MKNIITQQNRSRLFSRREFIRNAALGASAIAAIPVLGCRNVTGKKNSGQNGPASRTMPLDGGWLFGGKFAEAATKPDFDDAAFSRITLPHCVARLSWQNWNPADWEDIWIYRRHFVLSRELKGLRWLLQFDGVMVGTSPVINGHALPQHFGGYLPSRYEITSSLVDGDNVLAVAVDSRWSNVPPEGSPKGPRSVDYLEPGGIFRSARLQAVPQIFISEVFAKPVNVLDAGRRVEIACSIDAAIVTAKSVQLKVELKDGSRVIASTEKEIVLEKIGMTEAALTLSNLGNIALWDVDAPRLYDVVTTLLLDGEPLHDYQTRIGFREAHFDADGFFLNGRRLPLFGLDRHEIYPYVGFAMSRRVMRRDAEMLRHEFN